MSSTYSEVDPAVALAAEARPRVSWPAIFAGAVLVIAVQLMLSTLGAGIGLGFAAPGQSDAPSLSSLATGTGVWWLASTVVALLAGSFAAARLAGVATRFDGVLHGLVIWAVALLLAVTLLASAVGGLAGGAFSVLGGAVSAAADGAKAVLPHAAAGDAPGVATLQQQAESLLRSAAPNDPASMSRDDAAKAIAQAMPDVLAGGDKASAARQRVTDIVAAQAHISPDDARQRVDATVTRLKDAKEQAIASARHAAEVGAAAASAGSFLAFAGLVVGAVAAAIGGGLASPRRTFTAQPRFR